MPLLNKPLVSGANFQRTEQEIASLQKEVASQQQQTSASSNVPAPSVPLPCTGGTFEGSNGFVIAAQVDKKGEFDTFCATIPAGCTRLGTLLGKFSDQGIRDNTIFHWVDVPDDIAATGGHLEYMFPLNLKYNTKYGLIQLIAVVEDPVTGLTGRKKNPPKPWNAQTQQYSYLDTWTTGNALNAPATPICNLDPTGQTGDIIENTIYVDHDGGHARLTLRAYFAANRASTAGQMEATKIGVRLKPVAGGNLIQASAVANSDSDKFEDITISDLAEGAQFLWQDVWTKHGTGRAFSAAANCAITAGSVNIDAAAFAMMVNSATITFVAADAKHSAATITYTQPNPPFAIKKLQILRSIDGGVTYQVEEAADRPIAEGLTTAGSHSVTYNVKTKVAINSLWKVRMLARPGLDVTGPAFTNTGLADPTGDGAASGGVQNLQLNWTAKKGYKATWQRPATGFKSVQYYNVYFDNGFPAGSPSRQFMAAFDGQQSGVLAGADITAFGQAGATFQVKDTVWATHQRLANTSAAFGIHGGCCVHVVPINLVNGVETAGTEAIACLALATLGTTDNVTATDAVNVIDVSTTLWSPGQILFNGDFLYNNGVANQTRWWTFNGNPLDTNLGNNAAWVQSDHAVVLNGAGSISESLKRKLVPGDFYAVSWLVKGSGSGTVTINLQDAVTAATDVAQIPFVPISATGTYVPYGCVIQYNPGATANNNHLFVFGWSVSGGGSWTVDRIMMCRGKQPSAYTPRVESYEIDGATGNENPSIVPSSAAAGGFDLSNPTGPNPAQGRWFGPGAGGILPTQ